MADPLVTVLMTVYNATPFLDEAVRGVLDQTFEDFEFVIVDDASTDGSRERLEHWAGRDSRIRLFARNENSGQTACLNFGLERARGRWIARQDADDLSAPLRLERQVAYLTDHPETVLLGSNGWIVSAGGEIRGTINVPLHDAGIRTAMGIQNPFVHTSVVFRGKTSTGHITRYDERFGICQDWELWSRLAQRGRVANLRDRFVWYRDHEGSLSKSRAEQTRREAAEIVNREFKNVQLNDHDRKLLESFRNGLRAEHRREFWQLHRRLLRPDGDGRGMRQAAAVHHLQAAGALAGQNKAAMLAEIAAATGADWRYVVGFLAERMGHCGSVRRRTSKSRL